MVSALTVQKPSPETLMEVLANGNIGGLSGQAKLTYLASLCESLGLNPLTRPFQYLEIYDRNGGGKRVILYATKDATEQLRKLHGISTRILSRDEFSGVWVVTAQATDRSGRTDESIGAVSIDGLKGEALANAIMKAECVPLDSEILTHDGFKQYHELRIGEDVLAYDLAGDECHWTPLEAVSVYDETPVVRLFTAKGQFEVVCTSDHSWPTEKPAYEPDRRGNGSRGPRGPYRHRQPNRRLVKTSQLTKGLRLVVAAAERSSAESMITPVEAALLGWAITDGTIKTVGNSSRIGICQSKEQNFPVIRELVGAVAPGAREFVTGARRRTFPGGRTYDTKPQHWWYIPAAVTRAVLERAGFHDRTDLPAIVTRLSPPARAAMLQAMMLAEGDQRNVFANSNRYILDAFQILCALEGIATGQERPKGAVRTQRMKTTRHIAGAFLRTEDAGVRAVWCPTTAYGTWVMRQNGRVMITGNTKAKRRVTLSICGLGLLDETEVETIPGASMIDIESAPAKAQPSDLYGETPNTTRSRQPMPQATVIERMSRPAEDTRPASESPQVAAARKAFFGTARGLGLEVPGNADMTRDTIHAALGLPAGNGHLRSWAAQYGWPAAQALLAAGKTVADWRDGWRPSTDDEPDILTDDEEEPGQAELGLGVPTPHTDPVDGIRQGGRRS